jgi:hypothetical protein
MLNNFGVFHPRFYYNPRHSVESAMNVRVEIFKPNKVNQEPHWVAGETFTDEDAYTLVWRSKARVAPNKDWRARAKEMHMEMDAVHAMRVQVPIGGNELEGAPRDMPFYKDYMVRVIETNVIGTEQLYGFEYIVRNAHISGNAWLHNLLCDTGTRQQDNEWQTD